MDNLAISKLIYPKLDHNRIVTDFQQLALYKGMPKLKCRVGSDFVNYFTICERFNTVGRTGISFIDFLNNKDDILARGYVQKMIDWYQIHDTHRNEVWVLYRIFNLYFGAISIFQPHVAIYFFNLFEPKCVFSPCAGWGGILTAACAANVPHWIGCETNSNLREPYEKMITELHKHSATKIDIHFISCIDFNYKNINYDMVLYSPPYYNIEQYTDQPRRTKENWNAFYNIICGLSWRGLSQGGWYCVNVSNEIYDIYKSCIGRPAEFIIAMPNKLRSSYHPYSEHIFCWKKQ